MSSALNASYFEFVTCKKGFFRYAELTFKTIKLLYDEKADVVFVQNPSIVLAFVVVALRRIFGYLSVVDEHNAGLFPLEGRSIFLKYIARWIVATSDIVIVTNKPLSDVCLEWGGDPIIVPDPLPTFDLKKHNKIKYEKFRLLFICSWAEDEPFYELLDAASMLDSDKYEIRITGKPPIGIEYKCPRSVALLGFVSDEDFISELFDSDAVIVLTKRDNCLNCGAYEAVSAGKPGILSNTLTLREYFSKGFLFTDNSPEDIRRSIEVLSADFDSHSKNIDSLKGLLGEVEAAALDKLKAAVYSKYQSDVN
ncbi:hypothetical protein [Marinobacter shengliensis]|uniref:hypothetical protein n=1 Tax=Marinobacter shengliensis TaxID=1389223 RepID=UPI001E335BB9|nr:hypothetical protein [Marinobacter shengliensis]MCD1631310.1 hypothetical protein [Marinobacter shengliensis]